MKNDKSLPRSSFVIYVIMLCLKLVDLAFI